ncbi:hypothetical protein F5Y06DRAFT_71846 [Hypoxylon sp. FL0890]|nr:hypothetical protein F5Y06DRAFT_71846 [Hypoxylon sp. FL0890]
MPKTSKKLRRVDGSEGHRATPARSPRTKSETPAKESKVKPLQMPDSKPRPAVKDLTKYQTNRAPAVKSRPRSRSKPFASREASSHSTAATSQPLGLARAKASNSSQDAGQMKTPKVTTGGTPIRAKISAAATQSSERITQGGRRDPYLVPSDSEDDLPGPKPTSVPTRRESSASGRARPSDRAPKKRGSVLPSTPTYAATTPSPPTISSKDVHVSSASRHPQPRIATQLPPDAEVILIDSSSSNETPSHFITSAGHSEVRRRSNISSPVPNRTPSDSIAISVNDRSSNTGITFPAVSSRLRSATSGKPAPSQRSPSGILPRTQATLLTVASSQSDGEGASAEISTPVRPSVKVVEKRSSHSVNGHLNIIDEKTGEANREVSDGKSLKSPREVLPGRPKRELRKTKLEKYQGKDKLCGVPKPSSSSRAAIGSEKKNTKVKFEEDVQDEPMLESSFKESKHSDDEYQPSSTNEEQSSEDSGTDRSLSQPSQAGGLTHSAKSMKSSQSSPGRTLRNGPCPKPGTSLTPISKPRPKLREHVTKSLVKSEFRQGHSKHVHDGFSKASTSNESGDEDIRPAKSERRRRLRWDPLSWMDKYGAMFVPDLEGGTGRIWLADGPFKGWIYDGPGAGGYIPGCKAPDEDILAEAEKTAVPRMLQTWTDSEDDGSSDVKALCEDKIAAGLSFLDIHQDSSMTTNLECLATNPKGDLCGPVPLPGTSLETSRKTRLLPEAEDKATEREERRKRTKQYVLANISGKEINSQQMTDFSTSTSSKVSGSLSADPASAATPKHTPTPLSAASETTSALIAQQLIDDCAPPSNQELAELMSSSPAIRRVRGSSPAQKVHEQDGYVDDHISCSSSEPSAGIPARIPPKTLSLPQATRRSRYAPFRLEHSGALHVLNGVAERRTTRPLIDCSPSEVKTGQGDHGVEQVGADTESESLIPFKGTPIKTNIMVVLPFFPAGKRAEYEIVSPAEEPDSLFTATPKTFKEINKATEEMDLKSNDSNAEETLQYPATSSPPRSFDKSEPAAMESGEGVLYELQAAPSEVVATITAQKWRTKSGEKQKPTVKEGRIGEKRKRKTFTSDVSVTDAARVSKKKKTNDGQSPQKKLSRHQKKRHHKLLRKQHNKDNPSLHRAGENTEGLVKGNVGTQSTVTPPNTSRPTSVETK